MHTLMTTGLRSKRKKAYSAPKSFVGAPALWLWVLQGWGVLGDYVVSPPSLSSAQFLCCKEAPNRSQGVGIHKSPVHERPICSVVPDAQADFYEAGLRMGKPEASRRRKGRKVGVHKGV